MSNNGKKQRLFYLDVVRAVAVILILITHYNAWYMFSGNGGDMDKCVFWEFPFGIYVGNLGVSLFLIISGAALMYVYSEKIDLKLFYKKRFMSIYPMFWMAYLVAAIPMLGVWADNGMWESKWRIIFTFAGMDGYLSEYVSGFYILGEWFLGFIVLFYIIFPALRYMINKYEIITWIIIAVAYVLTFRYYGLEMNISKFPLTRLPELCFGMSFVKHRFDVKWHGALVSAAALVISTAFNPDIDQYIKTTYTGIAFFVLLVFVSKYIEKKFVVAACGFLTKYSYAVFLVHHVIIDNVQAAFDASGMTILKSYGLFAVTCCIIFAVAWMLQASYKTLMESLGKLRKNDMP